MNSDIPVPNPAVAGIIAGPEVRAIMQERGGTAALLYQAAVAKQTGMLAASTHVETTLQRIGSQGLEWVSDLLVGGQGAKGTVDHALPHEFGHDAPDSEESGAGGGEFDYAGANDLNLVLEELGSL